LTADEYQIFAALEVRTAIDSNVSRGKTKEKPEEKTEISEIDALPLYEELKKRWSYFIRKVYETDPLICPKCQGEMRIISFIDSLCAS
jgi:hypothetical protein